MKAKRSLSHVHRVNHVASLALAKLNRKNGAKHAEFLAMAATSRFYFEQIKKLE